MTRLSGIHLLVAAALATGVAACGGDVPGASPPAGGSSGGGSDTAAGAVPRADAGSSEKAAGSRPGGPEPGAGESTGGGGTGRTRQGATSTTTRANPPPQAPGGSGTGRTHPEPGKPLADKPKPRPPDPVNPPRGVKHDIPGPNDSDYSKRPNWESAIRENCTDAGYDEDCLKIVYTFRNGETGKSIVDPGTGYVYEGFKDCTATIKPPVGNPPELKPGSTIRFLITCTPEEKTSPGTSTGQPP